MENNLSGKFVCFTGKMETVKQDEQQKFLKSIGGDLITGSNLSAYIKMSDHERAKMGLSGKVNLIVVGKTVVNDAIIKYAEENGIEMIDEEKYLALLNAAKDSC